MTAALTPVPDGPQQQTVEFDIDNFTVAEVERWEELTGDDFDEAFSVQPILVEGKPLLNGKGEVLFHQRHKTKHLKALLRVALERTMSPAQAEAQASQTPLKAVMGSGVDPTGDKTASKKPRSGRTSPRSGG